MIRLDAFGDVVIVQEDDPRFGTVNEAGVAFGKKELELSFLNNTGHVLKLIDPPTPFQSNPGMTNLNFSPTGFDAGREMPIGATISGKLVFQPTMRGHQVGTVRFFTEPHGNHVLTGVGGIGIVNAKAELPLSIKIGESGTGRVLLRNRGDRPLVIDRVEIDDDQFSFDSGRGEPVPPEFEGGDQGMEIRFGFTARREGEQLGRAEIFFEPTDIGDVEPISINLSGGA